MSWDQDWRHIGFMHKSRSYFKNERKKTFGYINIYLDDSSLKIVM